MTTRKARRRRGALPVVAATAVALGAFSAPALGAELDVSKTLLDNAPATVFDRDWTLTKSIDPVGPVTTTDDSVAGTWTVSAAASDRAPFRRFADGTIEIDNPNTEDITGITLTDNAPAGATCGLTALGSPRSTASSTLTGLAINGGETLTVNWRCEFDDVATPDLALTNSASVAWEASQTADTTDSGQSDGSVLIDFDGAREIDRDATVEVVDPAVPALSFTATPTDGTRTADASFAVPALGCATTDNVATIDQQRGVDRSAPASLTVCREIIPPVVSKTANGSWLRVFDWKLDKRADAKSGYNHKGYFVRMGYTIDADRRRVARKNFRVNGRITVQNPNSVPVTITDVQDALTKGGAPSGANCTLIDTTAHPLPAFPAIVGAGEEMVVRYRCVFPADSDPRDLIGQTNAFSNTATATYESDLDGAIPVTSDADSAPVEVVFNAGNRRDLFDRVRITDRLGDTVKILSRGLGKSDELRDIRYLRAPKRGCVRHVNVARLVAVDADGKVLRNKKGAPRLREVARETVRICQKATPSGADPAPVVYSSEDPDKGVPAAKVKDQYSEDVEEPTLTEPGAVIDRPERLRVRKSVIGRKRVEIGDRVVFRIAVRNRGDEVARNVRVRDVLPRHLRATAVRGKTRVVRGLNRRVLNLRLPNIPAGKTRVIKVVTKVVSRPEATPRALRIANRSKGAKRRVAIARLRNGITCNVAIGRARAFRPDRDRACVRILPQEVLTP